MSEVYAFIEAEKTTHNVALLCRLLSLAFNLRRSPDLLISLCSRDSRAAVLHASRCRATSREGTAAGEESRR